MLDYAKIFNTGPTIRNFRLPGSPALYRGSAEGVWSTTLESFEMQSIDVVTSSGQYERKKEFARRSRLEICMDMLRAVKDGCSRPTQIMYRTNLSWISLQTNLKTLVDGGMLRWVESGNKKVCEMTDKGRTVLTSYRAIKEEIERALDGIAL